ncbi:Uncharacterised protein [Mycobacteroides abscessus subsp. abscessus]|nr:Uncharacterised protein [Mycobacteroides abscessus subsp. abscessus]
MAAFNSDSSKNLSRVSSPAVMTVASLPWTDAKVGCVAAPVRCASMCRAIAARSLATLLMTPTGTSTSKMSRSSSEYDSADSESPPRSMNRTSGARSEDDAPSSAAAASVTVSRTGRVAASLANWRSRSFWLSASSAYSASSLSP